MTKIDLTSMTTEALTQLAADVRGEMSRRAGEPLLAWRGSNCDAGESYHIPAGGALLCDRPAIGGDRSRDYWYPSLDAANAALRLSAGDSTVVVREDGTTECDYTASNCSESRMWTVSRERGTKG